ncbi:hypothetical protein RF55_13014 [Lasius niger]|uniref:Uncharacterized protein n=1 Tax=Lasius niger TaxID=67767 RepID=A0A0J7KBJ1_LASNI|nr:hypothetical protein RF55_13014 [Lasius niger]
MGKRIKKSLEGSEKQRVKRGGNNIGWWDEECRERKKEVRKELRNWRRIGGNKDTYKEMKKGYKEICEKKKREERERWVREAGKARTEGKVWDLIRKERKRKKKVNEEIEMEGWKKYFMIILGGVEEKVVREGRERRDEQEEMELEWEEVKRVIDGLKDGKAIGNDGIPNEKNGGQEAYVRERVRRTAVVMREVWGIGKRLWDQNWKRRLWLFDTPIWTVMGYGMGVERKKRDRGSTRKEEDRERIDERKSREKGMELKKKAGERERGGIVARKCWEEMKERWRRGEVLGSWEQERWKFLRERGVWEGEEKRVEDRGERQENAGKGKRDKNRKVEI